MGTRCQFVPKFVAQLSISGSREKYGFFTMLWLFGHYLGETN
jgi:hypothetical protein